MKGFVTILFFIPLVLMWGCKHPQKFEIRGKISNAEGKKIYLDELMVASLRPLDSAKINSSGEFVLRQHVGIPTFYLLKLSDNNFITLLLDSAEKVTIQADAINFSREYSIQGSPGSLLVQELNNKLNITKQKLDSISSLAGLFKESPDLEVRKKEWNAAYDKIVQDQIKFSTDFVSKNPFSMASVLALYQKFDDENYVVRDIQALRIAASALNSFYPKSEHVKALYANTLQLIAKERSGNIQKFIEEKGENSPDIVLPDQNGKKMALSSFRFLVGYGPEFQDCKSGTG
jgi:hypothetical protein